MQFRWCHPKFWYRWFRSDVYRSFARARHAASQSFSDDGRRLASSIAMLRLQLGAMQQRVADLDGRSRLK